MTKTNDSMLSPGRAGALELEGEAAPAAQPEQAPRRIELEGVAPEAIDRQASADALGVTVTDRKGIDFFGRQQEKGDHAYAKGGVMIHAAGEGVTVEQGGIRKLIELSPHMQFTVEKHANFNLIDGKAVATGYHTLRPSHRPDEVWHAGVSEQHETVQPLDGLLPLEQLPGVELERVGAWKGGRLVFASTKPVSFSWQDSDGVDHDYLGRFMIWNGLDGKHGWGGAGGIYDPICWNAMRAGMAKGFSLKHVKGINDQIQALANMIATAPEVWCSFGERLARYSRVSLEGKEGRKHLLRMTATLFPKGKDGTRSTQTLRKIDDFLSLYESGSIAGQQVVPNARPGTLEGFNRAATAYNTHINAVRSGRAGDPDAQFEYLMNGAGYTNWQAKADRAMHQTVQLVGAS